MDDGFSFHPSVISARECDNLLGELELWSTVPGRRRLIDRETIRKIASDPRLLEIAAEYISGDAIPFKATYFNKTEDSNWLVPWHQDRVLPLSRQFDLPDWGPWSVKDGVKFAHAPAWALNKAVALRLHLDDSAVANGPLRVIPGSYTLGVLDQKDVVEVATRSTTRTCVLSKGGVMAMRPLTIHASSKSLNSQPRRVLHVEYIDSLKLSDEIELAFC